MKPKCRVHAISSRDESLADNLSGRVFNLVGVVKAADHWDLPAKNASSTNWNP